MLACLSTTSWAADQARPNIIFMLIDDLGIGDVSAFEAKDVKTPNIDRLAKSGVRFTNGYVPFPICSPSRASAMTGLNAARFGQFGNSFRGTALPENHPTLPAVLKQAGYVTGMIGRLDLGSEDQSVFDLGFDEVAQRPKTLPVAERTAKSPWKAKPGGTTYLGKDGSYWTDVNREEIKEFIDRHKSQPFYLYYAPLAVHFPVQEAPQTYLDRVPKAVEENRRHFVATLIALDDTVGVLLDKLEAENLFDNTLIFFLSDNGGRVRDGARNGSRRGGKTTPWDGGFRIPYIISWPEGFTGGRTIDWLVSSLDVYPTAAAAAGAKTPDNLDGINLLPYLTGKKTGQPHDALFFRWYDTRTDYHDARIVRSGPWRLITYRNPWDLWQHSPTGWRTELFNLEADPGENNNLAEKHPEIVQQLQARYQKWEKTLPQVSSDHDYAKGIPMPSGNDWSYANEKE